MEFVRSLSYFADLGRRGLDQVALLLGEKRYDRNEVILLEGEAAPGLFFVRSGRARVYKVSPDGREQVLHLVLPGDSFGDVAVFDGGPSLASVQALEPLSLYFLPRDKVLSLVREFPCIAVAGLRVFAGRNRWLAGLVEDLSFRPVTGRVARVLLQNVGDGDNLVCDITQQDIASMAGTARETATRCLKSLETRGAIRLERRRIVITNRQALERTAQSDSQGRKSPEAE